MTILKRILPPLIVLIILSMVGVAQVQPRVYGVFIYSFAKSLQWPSQEIAENDFIIGILDHSALKAELEKVLTTKMTSGTKKMVVKEITNLKEIHACSILFVSNAQASQLNKLLERFPTSPVLIISEQAGQAKAGAGISFIKEGDKLRFEFNLKSIEARGIKVPSNLKSLGIQVDSN